MSKWSTLFVCAVLVGCAATVDETGTSPEGRTPSESSYSSVAGIVFGEPLAVTFDFAGNPVVADGLPGRVVRVDMANDRAVEFQLPSDAPGFYPSDLKYSGFFVYVLDEVGRVLLRFDKEGAYRDVLINFDEVFSGDRVTPVGLDVDESGRVAVSDVNNHQVIVTNSFLGEELVFGNYGSSPGKFDSPEGVSFTPDGGLVVTDSGNRRVQYFDNGGTFVRSIPRPGEKTPFARPRRAVVDARGNTYVADPEAGMVFVFDGEGLPVRTVVPAGSGAFRPTDVAVTPAGSIFVTDTASNSLIVFR